MHTSCSIKNLCETVKTAPENMAGSVPTPNGSRRIDEMFTAFRNKPKPTAQPSFAAVVSTKSMIPPVSDAIVQDDGEYKSVKINQTAFERRVQLCNHSLIGRLTLNKGELPWKLDVLRAALSKTWGISVPWRLISLGKGFYHLLLPSEEIKQQIRSRGVVNLNPGILRVQPWTPDFDPLSQKTTNAQVWVRLYNLPWVYWDPVILSDIARCLGGLIKIDRSTLEGDYGHFARIFLDIDMAVKLQRQVGIERDGKKFWIQVVYEDLPKFCKHCSSIGHAAFQCKQSSEHSNTPDSEVITITSKFKKSIATRRHVKSEKLPADNRSIKEPTPAPTKVWKPAEQKGNSIPVTRSSKRINDELHQKFPQRVRDHESGKFVEVEDVVSSSEWSSSEDDFEVSNGHLPMVNWHASSSYQQTSQPISVVFPDSPTHSYIQNRFELLSGLEENEDDTVRITEITSNDGVSPKRITWAYEVEETSVIDNAKSSKKVTAWADLFGSDSEPEKIDTELIDHSWRSNRNIKFAEHNHDANSDPEGWNTVERRRKNSSPTTQMEPHVQVPEKQPRNYFLVGSRKSKRQVRLPKKYSPS